ncbi:hypothetical protein GQ55_8G173200 [Panicum hallii var. hallii]|uniref:Uncharacterized protein n=2 Tax=Panicum hallii TaxID=206008 RepID=A0A2T7CNI4_9POAL|nr:hypothetical protein GQ55_8G173200 [Panicum hallii var. hallii]PVH34216.1 hypothetical protein PAHAL_8G174200 [Panicum hallii]
MPSSRSTSCSSPRPCPHSLLWNCPALRTFPIIPRTRIKWWIELPGAAFKNIGNSNISICQVDCPKNDNMTRPIPLNCSQQI